MPRPSTAQCIAQIEEATAKLNVHHVSAITDIPYTHVKKLLSDAQSEADTFYSQVSALFELHKTFTEYSELQGLGDNEREHNLEYQTVRLRKANADLKEVELKSRKDNLAPREDLEAVLSFASQTAAKQLDGLIPEIEMLIKDCPAHVIDAVAKRVAEARNAIATARLT